jgi:hypothetical protein
MRYKELNQVVKSQHNGDGSSEDGISKGAPVIRKIKALIKIRGIFLI